MRKIIFPKDFLWGVATSSYQIEGAYNEDGKGESIWDRFSNTPGRTYNSENGNIACDHYHLYEEDVNTMAQMGVKSYRFSFSWSRIFPEGTGRINTKGVDFYKRLIDKLLKTNIVPNATVFHWDLPQALEDKGGWTNRDITESFTEYAGYLFKEFGDLIPMWATFNEPNGIIAGYTSKYMAPGHDKPDLRLGVAHNIMLSHGKAVSAFRDNIKGNSKVGIVLDIWKSHPLRNVNEDIELSMNEDDIEFKIYLNAIYRGAYPEYILSELERVKSMPSDYAGDMKIINKPLDFQGVNCYGRKLVSRDKELSNMKRMAEENPERFTETGWEIYPRSIYDSVMIARDYCGSDMPIYITENGAAFKDTLNPDGSINDIRRIKFYEGYLSELNRAVKDGANVKGYYAWTMMDNFEWWCATSLRFGLLYVDYETRKRYWKDSAKWYSETVKNNGFSID